MDEAVILRQGLQDTKRTHSLSDIDKQRLIEAFQKRFNQATDLVEANHVKRYVFNPSHRTIWEVTGKRGEYQVVPESMFCNCDDYYYRVMSGKKQVCYHIIAQQLAEALGKYQTIDMTDASYAQVTSKWTPKTLQS